MWIRHVKRITGIFDVSIVTTPAYEQTSVGTREDSDEIDKAIDAQLKREQGNDNEGQQQNANEGQQREETPEEKKAREERELEEQAEKAREMTEHRLQSQRRRMREYVINKI